MRFRSFSVDSGKILSVRDQFCRPTSLSLTSPLTHSQLCSILSSILLALLVGHIDLIVSDSLSRWLLSITYRFVDESTSQVAKNRYSCEVNQMGDASFVDRLISHVRATSKYYIGYPKDLGPSRVLHFTSEREFVQLLHQGYPVVVAFTIRCNYSKHLEKVLEEAAAEFYPNVKFMRVECPKYPGFCITRQRKDYPFIEIFHSPEHAANQGRIADPNITKYSVKVLPFNYDVSAYGFREYFKQHGIRTSDPK